MHFLSLFLSLATAPVVFSQIIQDGYLQTFGGLTNTTQAPDYLTYRLVANLTNCLTYCNGVQGCGFVNIYHDVNGKGGSPLFTCSLYENCYNSSTATNPGGQLQPDGSVNSIADSDGWCKL